MFFVITKIFRILVILLLVIGAVYLGMRTYRAVYDFLDFQIVFYKWFLQAGEQANNVKEYAGGMMDTVRDFLGVKNGDEVKNLIGDKDISAKIQTFSEKLGFISGAIGTLVGVMTYKIGFTLVFGIKKTIYDFKSFIFDY